MWKGVVVHVSGWEAMRSGLRSTDRTVVFHPSPSQLTCCSVSLRPIELILPAEWSLPVGDLAIATSLYLRDHTGGWLMETP